jgi:HEAT repeat protein
LLLGTLDDKSIVDRLLSLLDDGRMEVHTTAAWGLSHLAVDSSAGPILQVFADTTDRCLAGKVPKAGLHIQLSHLAQAIGRMRYAPADPVLRKYVPRDTPLHATARAAALWALGRVHADQLDRGLAATLVERVTDIHSTPPEEAEVRRMAAIALGRMKAEECLPQLRDILALESVQSDVGYACAWAINQMTGEPIPDIRPNMDLEDKWFLTPIPDANETQ